MTIEQMIYLLKDNCSRLVHAGNCPCAYEKIIAQLTAGHDLYLNLKCYSPTYLRTSTNTALQSYEMAGETNLDTEEMCAHLSRAETVRDTVMITVSRNAAELIRNHLRAADKLIKAVSELKKWSGDMYEFDYEKLFEAYSEIDQRIRG